jgi:hypothetical protein
MRGGADGVHFSAYPISDIRTIKLNQSQINRLRAVFLLPNLDAPLYLPKNAPNLRFIHQT